MDRVSDEWLDEQISYYDGLGNEVSGLGMARCAALVELRDRRAAEQNVTTADLNLGPVTRLRVSDEELCRVGEVFALDSVTNSIIYGVPMRHLSLIVDEVIERRAAEREQAAPQAEPDGNPHGETLGEARARFTKEVDEMKRKVAEAFGVCEPDGSKKPSGQWVQDSQVVGEFDGERWRFTVERWSE